jgi:hypothetical protein
MNRFPLSAGLVGAALIAGCGDSVVSFTCDERAQAGICYTTTSKGNAFPADPTSSCSGTAIFTDCPAVGLLGRCTLPKDTTGAKTVQYLYPFDNTQTQADAQALCRTAGGAFSAP